MGSIDNRGLWIGGVLFTLILVSWLGTWETLKQINEVTINAVVELSGDNLITHNEDLQIIRSDSVCEQAVETNYQPFPSELFQSFDNSSQNTIAMHLPANVLVNEQSILVVKTDSFPRQLREIPNSTIITRDPARLFVTPNKAIYQPGDTIELDILVLNSFDLTPLTGKRVKIVMTDPINNAVTHTISLNQLDGRISVPLPLSSQTLAGQYHLAIMVMDSVQHKMLAETARTITVMPSAQPMFN